LIYVGNCSHDLSLLPIPSQLPAHPRLILTTDRADALRAAISVYQQAKDFFDGTLEQGEYLLGVGPLPHPHPNATGDARYALQRIYTLSILWVLTQNATWAARATEEALVVATWPCFDVPCGQAQLNTGEALHALAVALDWLYDYLSPSDRSVIIRSDSLDGERFAWMVERLMFPIPAEVPLSLCGHAAEWSAPGLPVWRRRIHLPPPPGQPLLSTRRRTGIWS
jgi:hypothetical protein